MHTMWQHLLLRTQGKSKLPFLFNCSLRFTSPTEQSVKILETVINTCKSWNIVSAMDLWTTWPMLQDTIFVKPWCNILKLHVWIYAFVTFALACPLYFKRGTQTCARYLGNVLGLKQWFLSLINNHKFILISILWVSLQLLTVSLSCIC